MVLVVASGKVMDTREAGFKFRKTTNLQVIILGF